VRGPGHRAGVLARRLEGARMQLGTVYMRGGVRPWACHGGECGCVCVTNMCIALMIVHVIAVDPLIMVRKHSKTKQLVSRNALLGRGAGYVVSSLDEGTCATVPTVPPAGARPLARHLTSSHRYRVCARCSLRPKVAPASMPKSRGGSGELLHIPT